MLEALSAGCYPLVSDIGGHRYIINDDRFFFEKGNVRELKEKLISILKSGVPVMKIDIKDSAGTMSSKSI